MSLIHPILPCGYNADPNNGDVTNGAGTNWALWPTAFDTFEKKRPLILTSEMLAVFEGCADVIIDCEDDTIMVPFETRVVEVIAA